MTAPPGFEGWFRSDLRARAAYAESAGIYRVLPAAVAVPASVQDLIRLVHWAREEGRRLTARGAGSSIGGSAVGPDIIVDLRERMPRRLDLIPQDRVAVASANLSLADLNQQAARFGLRLPPDPSSGAWATLGGMVACNAAGARSVKYGSVRPWVVGLEFVTADGEVGWLWRDSARPTMDGRSRTPPHLALARFHGDVAPALRRATDLVRARFPRVRKNASGYALDRWLESGDDLDLLIGAEGTLGLVTTVVWRLDPLPPARSALRIALGSLDDLEAAVRTLVALDPSAVELLDRTFLHLLRLSDRRLDLPDVPAGTQAILLVEFEAESAAAARSRATDAARSLKSLALDIVTALTPDEEHRLWTLRHAASPILASLPADRRSLQVIEDGCVPLSNLGAYIRTIRDAAAARGLTVVIFGHAGDGNVHVNLLPELARPDWPELVAGLYEDVQEAVLRLGGSLSGEHGDGRLRTPWLPRQYGPEVIVLFRQVKAAFDPAGILNPGVKLPTGGSPFSDLKVGPGATPLPDDIALALRRIEQTGGYARSRLDVADRPESIPEQGSTSSLSLSEDD
jgi:FAD/FMN-containing dehydrogenase